MPSDEEEVLYGKSRTNEVIEAVIDDALAWMAGVGIPPLLPEDERALEATAMLIQARLQDSGGALNIDAVAFISSAAGTMMTSAHMSILLRSKRKELGIE